MRLTGQMRCSHLVLLSEFSVKNITLKLRFVFFHLARFRREARSGAKKGLRVGYAGNFAASVIFMSAFLSLFSVDAFAVFRENKKYAENAKIFFKKHLTNRFFFAIIIFACGNIRGHLLLWLSW